VRWLHHALPTEEWERAREESALAPASLAREGFVHTSYRDVVVASARLYLPQGRPITVLRVDPRRLDARIEVVETPRGAMPHVHGAIPRDAVIEALDLDAFEAEVLRSADHVPDRVTGTRFGFVAFAGMTLLDLVGVLDPIARIASMGFDRTSTCEVVAAGPSEPRDERAPPRVSVWEGASATFSVERVRPPLEGFDVVVVPGGHGARVLEADLEVVAWLASFPPNRLTASVCTGALLLGAAGRLRGKRATTHASALGELARFGATAVRERVVEDGSVVTGAGVTAAIDVGLHLVTRILGDEAARRIAAQMEIPAHA
jgi:putative intracellular protease/amidase/uncharacterized protein (DUF952 family)